MDNGVDRDAVKKAAQNLQRKLVDELLDHEREPLRVANAMPAAAARAAQPSAVLDSARDMDAGVDRKAEKKAAQFLEQMMGADQTAATRELRTHVTSHSFLFVSWPELSQRCRVRMFARCWSWANACGGGRGGVVGADRQEQADER